MQNNLNTEGIVVLSLFDGMSCGQIALQKLGIKVKQYYAAEIDKHAIKVTQHNFPNTIQLGDVTKVFAKDLPKIDLLIGGSPCQGFSFAGKQLAFNDPRSKLFFEFVRLKNECNPTYFMLENVKMKKEFELIISKYLGVASIEVNSALLSAQNRKRCYWTNIANEPYGFFGDMQCTIPQPKDKNILLRDILEADVPDKYYLSDKAIKYFKKREFKYAAPNIRYSEGKASCIMPGNEGKAGSDMNLIVDNKVINDTICIDCNGNSNINKSTQITARYSKGASCYGSDPFIKEQTQKDNLVMQLNPSKESNNIQPYQQNRVYDINGIAPSLLAQMSSGTHAIMVPEANGMCTNFMQYTNDSKIRRLTPTECERLQTVPDGYTSCVSDTQRYCMLGNGWTVDVVAYIFSFIKF